MTFKFAQNFSSCFTKYMQTNSVSKHPESERSCHGKGLPDCPRAWQ